MKKAKALSVSIVIPVYNEEHHLKQCLTSVKKQTITPDEVIVVDNNSTDGSIEVAKKFKFVTVIKEPKQSVLYARTTGFNKAKGDIIGRIDADTLIDKNWVKNIIEIYKDEEVSAVTGPMYFYDMPLSPGNRAVDHLFKGPLFKYTKNFPFLAGNNMAIRKTAWEKIRTKVCDDQTIHEDLDIAIHLHKLGMRIEYSTKLKAGMSTRRYDDSPRKIKRYTKMTQTAFEKT